MGGCIGRDNDTDSIQNLIENTSDPLHTRRRFYYNSSPRYNQDMRRSPFYHINTYSNTESNHLRCRINEAKILSLLEFLPCYEYQAKGKEEDEECVICMSEFTNGDHIRMLPCMHSFHRECVDNWLKKSFFCPSCMEPVDICILASFTG
ncbi:hypothetical protein GJ496_000421 [Pomphorhynchus laevis]|nr:hypothetical protein GJ496_000421 [Pomphorhynchus laevis]